MKKEFLLATDLIKMKYLYSMYVHFVILVIRTLKI